ncbi:hypothetical protein A7K94_0207190 [Modestobacter sp. VKM Ac-2676]|nr:hypothetical protein A7K94_0207190 [Modestobacter sp. VKM Ac-2676]
MALAVVVPLLVALLVLVNVLGDDDEPDDDAVAEVTGTTSAPRGDLPPVEVDTPEVTPEAELACPVLMDQLPLELAGETARMVDSDSLFAAAWGDPAQVLVCGVDPVAPGQEDTTAFQLSGVQWLVDTADPEANVWTTVDRLVPVQVRVPASADSSLPQALSPIIATTLPYTDPAPAD